MSRRRFTRFGFIRRGAAATIAVGGVAGLDAVGASGAPERDHFLGTIRKITSVHTAEVDVDAVGVVRLSLAPDASVTSGLGRSGASAGLAGFQPKDRIAFKGTRLPGAIEASSVQSVYRKFSGVVVRDEGQIVRTTSGDVLVPPEFRPYVGGRLVPGSLLKVGVRATSDAIRPVAELALQR